MIFGATFSVLAAWAQDANLPWWHVYWYPTQQRSWNLDYSRPLGKERFPVVFERDWGEGSVYAGKRDYIGFEAFLTLELPVQMELEFMVAVDDGAELYIDGKKIIDLRRWDPLNPVREEKVLYRLASGKHNLQLRFFEWGGRAYIKFDIRGLDKLDLARELARLREQLAGLEKKLAEAKLETKGQLANVQKDLEALKQTVAKLEALASKADRNLVESIAVLKAHLAEMEERFGSREQTIKEQIAAIDGALAALMDAVTALERGLSAVEEKQGALEAEIQALEERVFVMETVLSESTSGWEVHWYEMVQPGVFGAKLGTSSFPLNFAFDWGYGRVYKLWDRVGFKAYAKVYFAKDSWHYVKVAANNCFALYVDGKKVLDHWGVGEALLAEEGELEIWLSAGWHDLELHYYEWEEQAWVSFYLK